MTGHTPDETGRRAHQWEPDSTGPLHNYAAEKRRWFGKIMVAIGAAGMVLGVALTFIAFWAHDVAVLRYLLTAALSFVVGLVLAFFGGLSLLADGDG